MPVFGGLGDVSCITAHADTGQFRVNAGAALLGVLELLQNHDACTLAHHESICPSIKWG